VYIGKGSLVKVAAQVTHGTSVGPVCKVGGEVEATIFQGYSNKQHDGFMGHSYIGEWCNFGAGTITSDLKNNYGTVSMWANGEYRDTGSLFLGLFMAAHSKVAINSVFNAGTVVGVGCNLFGVGFPPKYIPSYSWGGAQGLSEHRIADALTTAERVMARRNMVLSENERKMLEHVFHATATNRTR
jgi:UDP-N-acetylglucosamine diphosphorylase/glucosamine-1-phosphate N-acetyltransferase